MLRILWAFLAVIAASAISYFATPFILAEVADVFSANQNARSVLMALEGSQFEWAILIAGTTLLASVFGAFGVTQFMVGKLKEIKEASSPLQRGGSQIKALNEQATTSGILEAEIARYSDSFQDVTLDDEKKPARRTLADAFDYIGTSSIANAWVFPALYYTLGLISLIFSIVSFTLSPEATTTPDPGLLSSAATFIAALIAVLLTVSQTRRLKTQMVDLCRALNIQFRIDQYNLLQKDLGLVRQEVSDLNAENSTHAEKVISKALDKFVEQLEKVQGKELASVEERLKAISSAAKDLDRSYSDNLKQASKTVSAAMKDLKNNQSQSYNNLIKAQEKAASALQSSVDANKKALEKSVNDASTSLEKVAKSQSDAALEGLLPTLTELQKNSGVMNEVLSRMADSLEGLSKQQAAIKESFTSEDTAANVIKKAAGDMVQASKASRETVERFIALAERMRTISTSLRHMKGADGRSEVSKETAKKLTATLKELQDSVELEKEVEGDGQAG